MHIWRRSCELVVSLVGNRFQTRGLATSLRRVLIGTTYSSFDASRNAYTVAEYRRSRGQVGQVHRCDADYRVCTKRHVVYNRYIASRQPVDLYQCWRIMNQTSGGVLSLQQRYAWRPEPEDRPAQHYSRRVTRTRVRQPAWWWRHHDRV